MRKPGAQWTAGWEEYVRGSVVSKHAALIVQTFLVSTFARSSKHQDDDADSVDVSDATAEVAPLKLDSIGAISLLEEQLNCRKEEGPGLHRHGRANITSKALWSSDAGRGASADSMPFNEYGPMFLVQYAQHKLDKRIRENSAEVATPFGGATQPTAEFYANASDRTNDRFLTHLQSEKVKPNHEQLQCLTCIANRLNYERRRKQGIIGEQQRPEEEPMLDLIHGSPGTGKNQVIKCLR